MPRPSKKPKPHWIKYEEAIELLHYDQETGAFRWLIGHFFDDVWIEPGGYAGSVHSTGYIKINIRGVSYLGHRLAFLLMTGEWPRQTVDHIDRDRMNNAWSNLRDVSQAVNNQNRRAPLCQPHVSA